MFTKLTLAAALMLVGAQCCAALDKTHYRELQLKAAKAAQAKDWPAFKQALIEIGRELPGDTPTHMLRMASVEMHLGNKTEALRWMEKYAAAGLSYDVASDDDLAALAKDPAFRPLGAKMEANRKPVQRAELACSLAIADLMAEDLTYAPAKKAFFVSSVQHHSLYRVTLPQATEGECGVREVQLPADAKRWPTLAVSWDAKRKLIWLSTSAMPGFSDYVKEDSGKAALLAIDGDSGKVLRRLDLVNDSPAVLGDMSIAQDGTLYVTDSLGGAVYRVAAGPLDSAKLEKVADGMISPQTPVLAADGKRLFVADYPMGVAVIPLSGAKRNDVQYLKHPENIAMTGLDGLKLSGDTLIGIENGTEPIRIMRYKLIRGQTEVTAAEVIEQSTDRLGTPTHVIESGGWFYVIANVGWEKIGDDGKLLPEKQFTAPVLLRFPAH